MFIDASALGELTSQLTSQDLESLVGFNIQPADLEALQEATEGHVSIFAYRGKLLYLTFLLFVELLAVATEDAGTVVLGEENRFLSMIVATKCVQYFVKDKLPIQDMVEVRKQQ